MAQRIRTFWKGNLRLALVSIPVRLMTATEREKEILQLLAVGVSATDELADRLYISQKTVKNHLASIFQKLAVSDRTQAAIEAIRLGIARPN